MTEQLPGFFFCSFFCSFLLLLHTLLGRHAHTVTLSVHSVTAHSSTLWKNRSKKNKGRMLPRLFNHSAGAIETRVVAAKSGGFLLVLVGSHNHLSDWLDSMH